MINQDILENQVKSIYLGIGSNLGNRKKNIEKAKFMLAEKNVNILNCSSFYESLSWPNQMNPKFLNIVLKVSTRLSPLKLLDICKKIETILGRKKSIKNSPRVCDIDIIDYHNRKININLVVPHPRMHKRSFVLLPLFEINKRWMHPVFKNHIKKLILLLPNRDIRSIKKI